MDIALYVISTTGGRYGNCIICNIQIQAALGIALYVISSLTAGVGHCIICNIHRLCPYGSFRVVPAGFRRGIGYCIICNTHIGHSGSRRTSGWWILHYMLYPSVFAGLPCRHGIPWQSSQVLYPVWAVLPMIYPVLSCSILQLKAYPASRRAPQ